jgi:hypothetical protein
MSGDDGVRPKLLDHSDTCLPGFTCFGAGRFCKILVDVVVDDISGHHEIDVRNMNEG